MLISDKIAMSKQRHVTRDKDGHFIVIKGSIFWGKYNNYKYIYTEEQGSQMHEAKLREIIVVIVEDYNVLVSIMDSTTRQEIYKEVMDSNSIINQQDHRQL